MHSHHGMIVGTSNFEQDLASIWGVVEWEKPQGDSRTHCCRLCRHRHCIAQALCAWRHV